MHVQNANVVEDGEDVDTTIICSIHIRRITGAISTGGAAITPGDMDTINELVGVRLGAFRVDTLSLRVLVWLVVAPEGDTPKVAVRTDAPWLTEQFAPGGGCLAPKTKSTSVKVKDL